MEMIDALAYRHGQADGGAGVQGRLEGDRKAEMESDCSGFQGRVGCTRHLMWLWGWGGV